MQKSVPVKDRDAFSAVPLCLRTSADWPVPQTQFL